MFNKIKYWFYLREFKKLNTNTLVFSPPKELNRLIFSIQCLRNYKIKNLINNFNTEPNENLSVCLLERLDHYVRYFNPTYARNYLLMRSRLHKHLKRKLSFTYGTHHVIFNENISVLQLNSLCNLALSLLTKKKRRYANQVMTIIYFHSLNVLPASIPNYQLAEKNLKRLANSNLKFSLEKFRKGNIFLTLIEL